MFKVGVKLICFRIRKYVSVVGGGEVRVEGRSCCWLVRFGLNLGIK